MVLLTFVLNCIVFVGLWDGKWYERILAGLNLASAVLMTILLAKT